MSEINRTNVLNLFQSKEVLKICAPMVRYSKLQFRNLVRKYNCDLCFTPMILADSFCKSSKARNNEFTTNLCDSPLITQFAANTVHDFVGASYLVSPFCDGVDLNCGCPQRWARQEGLGCIMLDKPQLIFDLVRQCRNQINKPFTVSVKMRILKQNEKTVEICKNLEHCGVSFLTIHGRTIDRNTGEIDKDVVKLIGENVNIPIIANGGVKNFDDFHKLHEYTKCKGIMVANGILANPSLFTGTNCTPLICVQDWLNICYNSTLSSNTYSREKDKNKSVIPEKPPHLTFQCFHHHLTFMLEKLLARKQKQIFNNLQKFSDVLQFLDDNFGIAPQLFDEKTFLNYKRIELDYNRLEVYENLKPVDENSGNSDIFNDCQNSSDGKYFLNKMQGWSNMFDEKLTTIMKSSQQNAICEKIWKILQNYFKENSISLKSVEKIESMANNFLSDVARYRLEGLPNDFRMNVVMKEIPSDGMYVEIYNCTVAFSNEKLAYQRILPNLTEFSARPLCLPNCIFASDDTIVLEDLRDQGYQHLDVLKGFTVEQVKLVLSELANFHAASFLMQHKDKNTFQSISNLAEEILYKNEEETLILLSQEKSLDTLIQVLNNQKSPVYFKKHLRILNELKGKTLIKQLKLLNQNRKFCVMNHGDLWCNNIMFNKNENRVKFLDFQTMRCTSVAADLSYFLYVNLDPDFRMQYKDEFLRHYLHELHENIGNLPIKLDLNIKWLNSEMDKFALFGFICAIWILPIFYHKLEEEKSGESFLNCCSITTETTIANMLPEQKNRLIRLISTYAQTVGF